MNHSIRNNVPVVRRGCIVFIGHLEDWVSEPRVEVVAHRIALDEIVAKSHVDWHFGSLFIVLNDRLCAGDRNYEQNCQKVDGFRHRYNNIVDKRMVFVILLVFE